MELNTLEIKVELNTLEIKRVDFRSDQFLDVRGLLLKAGFDLSGAKSIDKEVTGDVIRYTQVK